MPRMTALPPENPAGRSLAIFDFDGTLVAGDSLLPFLERVVGRNRARFAMARAIQGAVARHAVRRGGDIRTSVKALLLANTLTGIPVERARGACEGMRGWLRWHKPLLDTLKRHKDRGDTVVVATGALALYMPSLLEGLGVDVVLATGLEERDGVLTGRMDADGNCVRDEKARRVTAWMRETGPWHETHGYGNRPSDLPFLALMTHPTIVPTVGRKGTPRPGI
ncbi:MAG TPA: HAD-IB family hydrolase [Azospirillaceae bacterium]|nr:HAD-IB family hydrolase [Azospirillaceae bacterium]